MYSGDPGTSSETFYTAYIVFPDSNLKHKPIFQKGIKFHWNAFDSPIGVQRAKCQEYIVFFRYIVVLLLLLLLDFLGGIAHDHNSMCGHE